MGLLRVLKGGLKEKCVNGVQLCKLSIAKKVISVWAGMNFMQKDGVMKPYQERNESNEK